MASFERALRDGADALELDAHVTADGHVVALHDPTVDRTTTGTGAADRLTLDAIGALAVRGGADGARIATLDALLEAFPHAPLMIDAKTPAVGAPLRRAIERHGAASRVLVGSFHASHLAAFAGSRIGTIATRSAALRLLVTGRAGRATYAALSVPFRLGRMPLPMRHFASAARRAGRPLHVWTVNDPALARRLWDAGACGIITDDPALLVQARRGASR